LCAVFELLESIAFSGLALNVVVYLGMVLHGSTAFNAAHVDTWNGTTFIVPVIGAFLADSYWGKYRTILASIAFYLVVSPMSPFCFLSFSFFHWVVAES
jgi:peptide/histidine transporter 3/4